jgi:hypothetical protein
VVGDAVRAHARGREGEVARGAGHELAELAGDVRAALEDDEAAGALHLDAAAGGELLDELVLRDAERVGAGAEVRFERLDVGRDGRDLVALRSVGDDGEELLGLEAIERLVDLGAGNAGEVRDRARFGVLQLEKGEVGASLVLGQSVLLQARDPLGVDGHVGHLFSRGLGIGRGATPGPGHLGNASDFLCLLLAPASNVR